MEWIQTMLDSSTTPLLTAFLLGLLTAISPCPMATNITAVGYISKDIQSRHTVFFNGLLYTLGRVITYSGIGLVLIPLLRQGISIYGFQKLIGKYGEMLIGPALILIGLFMLFGDRLNLPKFGYSGGETMGASRGKWGALLLGILFSLAFCPSSGLFYFGMLMPLSAAETDGYLLPLVYAVATGLPVILIAWIIAYSLSGIGEFYKKMVVVQRWMNKSIALLFIGVGVYYLLNL
ncbi:MAG: aromatic aminobenezylarsenical efflux permease ArsG family transporter [Tannerellaceae bacterium]